MMVLLGCALLSATPAELMTAAQSHYDALDFEAVLAATDAVLSHEESSVDARMDAYWLMGSALVALGFPVRAEKPFRFLLRGRPSTDVPAGTSPKIEAVFRKVQAEDREARAEAAALARKRLIGSIALLDPLPTEVTGGLPLSVRLRLADPSSAVAAVELRYRRTPGADYSALALRRDFDGSWVGVLSAEWTENEDGVDAEVYVATLDAAGDPLFVSHRPTAPASLRIRPGSVGDHAPFYARPWFWIVAGAAAAAAAGVGWYTYDRAQPTESLGGIWRPE